ncbi:acetylcholinesterase 1-like isoform X3 [Haliotis cracherodii]|uniref:acetylcholinesterase 1-like isoform X3 n=1 Tax=Haliotis cracherodii TaxID=6455 RepID=UPI0039EAABEF
MMKQCGSLDLTQRNVMEGDCVVYFLGFLLLCAQRAVDAVNNPTVVTQNGAVRGITHEFGGRQNRKFTHRMSNHPWGDWMGVLHADEINFVFGEPLNRTKRYTAHEKELSKKMMRYWTNFAKTGDPNRGPDEVSLGIWPEYSEKQQYLELNLNLLKLDAALNVGTGPRTKQCAFWKHYLPRLVAGTADISSVEKDWKESYNEWKTRYIVDWKHQFDSFLKNYERRFQTCGMP